MQIGAGDMAIEKQNPFCRIIHRPDDLIPVGYVCPRCKKRPATHVLGNVFEREHHDHPSCFQCLTHAERGLLKGEVGEANWRSGKCQTTKAHDVSGCTSEDRGGSACSLGNVESESE